MKAPEAKCPAAEMTRTVVSHNDHDVRCHIQGIVRGAKDSPCCGDYWRCAIWKTEKDRLAANKRAKRADMYIGPDGWKSA